MADVCSLCLIVHHVYILSLLKITQERYNRTVWISSLCIFNTLQCSKFTSMVIVNIHSNTNHISAKTLKCVATQIHPIPCVSTVLYCVAVCVLVFMQVTIEKV